MTDQADTERYMNIARRWFNQGWSGNSALADDLFSENVRTNRVLVGVAGPKRRIEERLAVFADLTRPSRICSQPTINHNAAGLARNAYRPIWGVKAAGKPVAVRDFAVRRFEDGKVAEIWTIQDQFALLKQIG